MQGYVAASDDIHVPSKQDIGLGEGGLANGDPEETTIDVFKSDGSTITQFLVINSYINLIKAEKHLLCAVESTIYIENTLIVGLLQRDGKNKEKIKPNIKQNSIVERLMKYMAHDLVFLPINIEEMHWYLAMVNRKRCDIQVLNSLGPMRSDDLGHVLQIDAALGVRDITDDKWPDLQVSSWSVVEQFYHRMQTDGVSYGLFLLNFMEYWMGEKLSNTFTQVRSSDPYPISLSLKNLQDILDVNRTMDVDVFNLAMRMLACDMATMLREPKSHFMDLMFSVVVPYYACRSFGMFALDKHARRIAIIDHSPVHHNPAYNHPSYYYLPRIQKMSRTYDCAMDEIDPSWNDDIYDWNHIYLCLVPKIFDR
ncbi:hypothetical protein SETIT_1G145800v2 [Setaria italica]|uniref:Ubiquitin-like protease family profile domain-containing protein n=1 Tax=Setaria italica TaxID=4555 RepID=K3YXT1_SETIT|nr:hypothetical protein SETIT_1G145800v2 [Setaria italica]